MTEGYEAIIKRHNINLLILVDGGNDALMRGNEQRLGSPHEDSMSIAGVYGISPSILSMDSRLLTCIGFGVDHFHGVNSCLFFENTSSIISKYDGGYKGVFSVLRESPSFKLFKEASEYTFKRMPTSPSIVASCIIAAIEGKFGDFHPPSIKNRTQSSKLFINPMMGMYWVYSLEAVANQLMYLSFIKDSKNMAQLDIGLRNYRQGISQYRNPTPFPH